MALVAIVLIPLFTLPTRRVGKTRWNLTREAQERQDEINDILGGNPVGQRPVTGKAVQ